MNNSVAAHPANGNSFGGLLARITPRQLDFQKPRGSQRSLLRAGLARLVTP